MLYSSGSVFFLPFLFPHLLAGEGASIVAPAWGAKDIPELGAERFFAKQILENVDPLMENNI